MAQSGYDVAFTYNSSQEEALSLKNEIEDLGRRCFLYQASLEKPGVAEAVTYKAIEDLGHLDVMVCNAGRTLHHDVLGLKAEDMDFIYNLDYLSYLMCGKTAANAMVSQGIKGSVIMISSTRGVRTYPEDPLYGGIKAGLHRFCESMALEYASRGITVNCIAPGATAIRGGFTPEELTTSELSKRIPVKRMGTPGEIGAAVRFLSSEEAWYITGTVLRVDGGLILPAMPEDGSERGGRPWGTLPGWMKR